MNQFGYSDFGTVGSSGLATSPSRNCDIDRFRLLSNYDISDAPMSLQGAFEDTCFGLSVRNWVGE